MKDHRPKKLDSIVKPRNEHSIIKVVKPLELKSKYSFLSSPRGARCNISPTNNASSIDSKETKDLNKDLPMQAASYRAKILRDHKRSVFTP